MIPMKPAAMETSLIFAYLHLGETSNDPTILGAAVLRLCNALLHERVKGEAIRRVSNAATIVPFELGTTAPALRPVAG